MVTGPQQMPVFSNKETLTVEDKQAILAYIDDVKNAPNPGGQDLRAHSAPSPRVCSRSSRRHRVVHRRRRLDRSQSPMSNSPTTPPARVGRRPGHRAGQPGSPNPRPAAAHAAADGYRPQGSQARRAASVADVPRLGPDDGAVRDRLGQIPANQNVTVPFSTAQVNASNAALGITFGLAIFLIGAGAIHWAKKLMPDQEEVVQLRHSLVSTPEERAEAGEVFWQGADESGFSKHKMIRRLLTAMILFPIPLVVMLRDLNPGQFNFEEMEEIGSGRRVPASSSTPQVGR